jgi:hypothetical protein
MISVLEGGYNVKLGHFSPFAQSVGAHVRALSTTHDGEMTLDKQWIEDQKYQGELLSKRENEDKAALFKELLLNNGGTGMTLRKRQRVTDEP